MNFLALLFYFLTRLIKTRRYKRRFLAVNNQPRTEVEAGSQAIAAAVKHNILYADVLLDAQRTEVRQAWRDFLTEMGVKYATPQTEEVYGQDIQELKNTMNTNFTAVFQQMPNGDKAPGFRISHAQKSLGVFLKHLWCLNRIPMPPQCPVDSTILKKAGSKYPEAKFGYVNTIEEHQRQIQILKKQKPWYQPLAEWELWNFEQ